MVPVGLVQVGSVAPSIAVGPFVLEIAAVVAKVHPLASFTSMVCDPAARPV